MPNNEPEDLEQLADMFKALSNPHRLQLFLRVAGCCAPADCCSPVDLASCVGSLAEGLAIAPSTVSHHMKALRQAGLLVCRRDGRRVHCALAPEVPRLLETFLAHLAPEIAR